jgi:hypothetical protein
VSSLETSFDAYAGSASVATENLTNIMLSRIDLIVTQGSVREFHSCEDPRMMFVPRFILVTITVETLIASGIRMVLGDSGYIISTVIIGFFESFVRAMFEQALSVSMISRRLVWSWLWRFWLAFASRFVDVLRNRRN